MMWERRTKKLSSSSNWQKRNSNASLKNNIANNRCNNILKTHIHHTSTTIGCQIRPSMMAVVVDITILTATAAIRTASSMTWRSTRPRRKMMMKSLKEIQEITWPSYKVVSLRTTTTIRMLRDVTRTSWRSTRKRRAVLIPGSDPHHRNKLT